MQKLLITIVAAVTVAGCVSLGGKFQNAPDVVTVALMGTNDIHGTAFPKHLIRTDNREQYKYGGLVYMARLLNIIKEEYGSRAIYLDTGDQYQGGVEAGPQASKGEIIADFFHSLDLKASAIGNHQFDYGKQFLINYLNARNSTSLAANLYSEKGEANFLPNQKSTEIFELNGIKMGVIGLATTETPTTTSGFISGKFPRYSFLEYPAITIRYAEELRSRGAQIIVVLAHFGNKCPWNKTYDIRTNETMQEPCEDDEVIDFIERLPEGTIDGILCGHRHEFAHHWYRNIPFMGSIDGGYYFNVMYFHFNTVTRKVVGTAIEGPIPVCEKIFANSRTCQFHTDEELINAGPLTSWVFHDKTVQADQQVNQIFEDKYMPQMQKFMKKVADNEFLLDHAQNHENSLANLITTLMIRACESKEVHADFSIINHGAFRSTWYPGVIQDQHFHNMFPFDNYLNAFEILGADLVEMLRRVQNGWDGFYFTDGIRQVVSLTKVYDPADPEEFQTKKGFVNATLMDGSPIVPNKLYTGVTVQFLLQGGDDFVKVFGEYINSETNRYFDRIPIYNVRRLGQQRQLLYEQMVALGTIRRQEWKVNPDNPRLIVINL